MVLGRQATPGINHKNDHIRLGHCLLRLARHFLVDATGGIRLEATCVNDDIFTLALATIAIVPVACQPRVVRHNGVTRLRQTVEKSRLADVGAPYKGDDWLHGSACIHSGRKPKTPPFWVTTTRVSPATTGAAAIAEPSVDKRFRGLPSSRESK